MSVDIEKRELNARNCATEGSIFNGRETSMGMCTTCYAAIADYVLSVIKFFYLHMSVWVICWVILKHLKVVKKSIFNMDLKIQDVQVRIFANKLPHFAINEKKSLAAYNT